MAKTATKGNREPKVAKTSKVKEKKDKQKDRSRLVGRVKKVVKKTKRKLSDDKFEKELQRTITFLEELRVKIGKSNDTQPDKSPKIKAKAASNRQSKGNSAGSKKKDSTATTGLKTVPAATKKTTRTARSGK